MGARESEAQRCMSLAIEQLQTRLDEGDVGVAECTSTHCLHCTPARLHSGNGTVVGDLVAVAYLPGSTYPLVTKDQSMQMKISNCQGSVVP
jgi:hypothetical protein